MSIPPAHIPALKVIVSHYIKISSLSKCVKQDSYFRRVRRIRAIRVTEGDSANRASERHLELKPAKHGALTDIPNWVFHFVFAFASFLMTFISDW